jgi:hypothetical protein
MNIQLRTTAAARMMLSCMLGLCLAGTAFAQAAKPRAAASAPVAVQSVTARAPAPTPAPTRKLSRFRQQDSSPQQRAYYVTAWGVDKMKVSYTASGNLIRFSYRVSEPERAKPLGDKKFTPYMIGQRSRAVLQVPVMDKVGTLRQATAPQAGQEYWMVFSNKGNFVRPGDRVNVVIGAFHADGLMVD